MGQKQSTPATAPTEAAANANTPSQNPTVDHKIGAALETQSNPSDEDSRSHNFGQPLNAPHSLPKEDSDETSDKSKLVTDCSVQHRASLRCIEENYENKQQACAEFFEAYKKCRRDEHERKLQENARRTGGQRHGFW